VLVAQFAYDVLGRRVSKAVDTTPLDAVDAAVLYFAYDRDGIMIDFVDADGYSGIGGPSLAERYLHGADVDQIFARENALSAVDWYLTDDLGTVRDIANNDGLVFDHLIYDAFGAPESSSASLTRHTFTGREYDADLDLYYYRARYMDPTLGRFIGQDPLGFEAGDLNLFRYVNNEPVGTKDPYGLESVVDCVLSFARHRLEGKGGLCQNLVIEALDFACAKQLQPYGKNKLKQTPQLGDIMVFENVYYKPLKYLYTSHVGIVIGVSGNKVTIAHQNVANVGNLVVPYTFDLSRFRDKRPGFFTPEADPNRCDDPECSCGPNSLF
jgi:RHS repeat-associated protein